LCLQNIFNCVTDDLNGGSILNRSMSFSFSSGVRELRAFDHTAQQWGTWLGGFPWQFFCTATYKRKMALAQTESSLRAFFDKLGRALGNTPVAYVAALERRTSGLGMPPIAAHWHFMYAVPEWKRGMSAEVAKELWRSRNGRLNIRRYSSAQFGAFYTSKLAAHGCEPELRFDNLDRLTYRGPHDLFEAAKASAYVPDHVKHLTYGQTLVLRDLSGEMEGGAAPSLCI